MDPFRIGLSAPCIGLLTVMTRGWEFPWRDGGVALMRREVYPSPGEWLYCGIAYGADATVRNYKCLGHSAGQAYQYAAVVFLGNGFCSQMCEPVRVDFDDEGDRITPAMPNPPVSAVATAIAGGKFRIVWEYQSWGHGAYPADFQVFEGPDPASVDYETALVDSVTGLSVVPYKGTGRIFKFHTAAFGAGSVHVFGVRSRNSNGVAELNAVTTAPKRAAAELPVAAPAAERALILPVPRIGG